MREKPGGNGVIKLPEIDPFPGISRFFDFGGDRISHAGGKECDGTAEGDKASEFQVFRKGKELFKAEDIIVSGDGAQRMREQDHFTEALLVKFPGFPVKQIHFGHFFPVRFTALVFHIEKNVDHGGINKIAERLLDLLFSRQPVLSRRRRIKLKRGQPVLEAEGDGRPIDFKAFTTGRIRSPFLKLGHKSVKHRLGITGAGFFAEIRRNAVDKQERGFVHARILTP